MSKTCRPWDVAETRLLPASVHGQPPYRPAMMTALLLYAHRRLYSSRAVARACAQRLA